MITASTVNNCAKCSFSITHTHLRPKEKLSRSSQTNETVCFVTARRRSCEKVMFSVVFVCLSVHRELPCDHYPWSIGPHFTGIPLDKGLHFTGTVNPPSTLPNGHGTCPPCPGNAPLLSNGQNWRHVQICLTDSLDRQLVLTVERRTICMLLECFLVLN